MNVMVVIRCQDRLQATQRRFRGRQSACALPANRAILGADVDPFRSLEAFTIFAVQFRDDADPAPMAPMGLDRAGWLRRAEQLVEHGASLIGGGS